ncbi:MAG: cytochrome c oxidase assembly protein [Actinomycetota bacterium]|nr:cytochrome c oxidase assembly protein [Actinomycetota bacterium]
MIPAAAVPFPHWHPHVDVWALIGAFAVLYLLALRRERARRPGEEVVTRAQGLCFAGALGTMLLASDWPVHDVAEGYLYSVHMVQHLLLTLVVALLLLAGIPTWMARNVLGRGRLLRVVRTLSRPVFGLVQFNVILVLSHWPVVVEATVRYHPLHFVAHAVLLASAVLMWMPVASPLPEIRRIKPPAQMLYLFLQTIVPTVPASFLTFNDRPLYRIYASFPRLWGVSALTDQQTAGLIMKIVGGLFLWLVIGLIFFRWYASEERQDRQQREGVLLWDDVEQELLAPPKAR